MPIEETSNERLKTSFQYKISPLSDTTNLASATAGTDLFTHIKYMQNTTIPTILLTIIIFTCISLFGELDTTEISVGQMQSAIAEVFNVSPLLFVVPVIVIVMIAKKCAPIPTLFIGGVLGGIAAVIAQPDVVAAIAGESSLTAAGAYKVVMQAMYGPTEYATGNEMLNNLFATNGVADNYCHGVRWSVGCRPIPRKNHIHTDQKSQLFAGRYGYDHCGYVYNVQYDHLGPVYLNSDSGQDVQGCLPPS